MKRFFALAVFLFFIVSVLFFVPGQSYAINPQPEPPGEKVKQDNAINESYIGTIVKIEGNKITVRNERGVDKAFTGNFVGVKLGEKVRVTTKNGLTSFDFDPQPEPPKTKITNPASK